MLVSVPRVLEQIVYSVECLKCTSLRSESILVYIQDPVDCPLHREMVRQLLDELSSPYHFLRLGSDIQKHKLSVYSAVSKVCEDVGSNNTYIGKFDVSPDAKAIFTELIWKKMEQYSEDLEAFAHHAKRSKINVEDVKLLFRRSEKILEEISKFELEENEKPTEKAGKRKRGAN